MLVPVYITTNFTGYYCFNKNNEKRDKNNQHFKMFICIYLLIAGQYSTVKQF